MGGLGRRLLQTASFIDVSCLHPYCAGHAPSRLKDALRHNGRRKPVPVSPRLRRTAHQRRLSANVIYEYDAVEADGVETSAKRSRVLSSGAPTQYFSPNPMSFAQEIGTGPSPHRPRRITCARLVAATSGLRHRVTPPSASTTHLSPLP
jgi:hypothetical protein